MTEMKIELLNLIKDYIQKGKSLDKDYMMAVLDIIVKHRSLTNYVDVNRTKFIAEKGDTVLDYSSSRTRRNIRVFTGSLEASTQRVNTYRKVSFNTLEKEYNPFLVTLEGLYHETEHAFQQKKIDQMQLDPETTILVRSLSLETLTQERSIQRIIKLYNKYWIYAPEERLAQIRSLEVTINLLRMLGADKDDELLTLFNYKRCRLLYESFVAYKRTLTPTEFYFEKMGLKSESMSNMMNYWKSKRDLSERVELGLEISKEEFLDGWSKEKALKMTLK